MPFAFDATTKHLIEMDPSAWLRLLNLIDIPAEIIDADLSTVSADADKVIHILTEKRSLLHWELQSGYDLTLPDRTLLYSILLKNRHHLPVRSVVLLLHPKADGAHMSGVLVYENSEGIYNDFRYEVIRLWLLPVKILLEGGLATLPLATLAMMAPDEIETVFSRMRRRIESEATPKEIGELLTASGILMGLRYKADVIKKLMQGVIQMKESSFYQMILDEGREEGSIKGEANEARKVILRIGRKRFGEPNAATSSQIEDIESLEKLEMLIDRLLEVESWGELLPDSGLDK